MGLEFFLGSGGFLIFLGLVWALFASIQDIRKEEVANWVNYSLLGFALAYRAFYSVVEGNAEFFLFGMFGVVIFFGLANLFYYARVFGGGDAKLLMAFGAILPYSSYFDLLILSTGFVLVLFTVGAVYSLIYGVFVAYANRKKFSVEFGKALRKNRWLIGVLTFFMLVFFVYYSLLPGETFVYWGILVLALIGMFVIYIFVLALDKIMVRSLKPRDLREGDWLEESVKISRGNVIEKSVHGLSFGEIKKLKKMGKRVLIKKGAPFVPVFFLSLLIMGYVYLVLELQLFQILKSFF